MQPTPFFFLHIPRTAGTTLNSILESNFQPEEVLSIYSKDEYAQNRLKYQDDLAQIKLILGHLLLDTTDPPTLYGLPMRVLTFLRDPLSRLHSEYDFLRTWKANHMYAYLNDNSVSFSEYITSSERRLFYRGKNFMTRCISGMDTSEKKYPAAALARAKKNLDRNFCFVGIQERFTESLLMLGETMGLTKLLHNKRNALTGNTKTELTEDDLAVAREWNRADLELYAFAEQLFASRVAALGPEFQKRVAAFEQTNKRFQRLTLAVQKRFVDETSGIAFPKDGEW